MAGLSQRVLHAIRRHRLCAPDSRVLIGLSGGADSVALTLLLAELAGTGALTLVGLAHLNHGMRDTAVRDEAFCRELAARLVLPITVDQADVRGLAARARLSIEDAARRLRYAFLARTAGAVGADRIAVGHTEDDQAETVLFRLVRGAGLPGLAGIYPRRDDRVVRPLIGVSRTELREYLSVRGQAWVEDETNKSLDNPRNRIRHRVLPELDAALGGSARPALARVADLARQDAQWLDEIARARFGALAREVPGALEIEAAALLAEPVPLRRRILRQGLRLNAPDREIGLSHVEIGLDVLEGGCRAADVPGSRVELRSGKLVLLKRGPETGGSDPLRTLR